MNRTRIGLGIYRTAYGFAVIWKDAGRNREKHFAPDTPHTTLTAFRRQQTKTARHAPGVAATRGRFARDVVRYLRTRKGKPCYKSERSHLKAWLPRFGRGGRHAITPEAIQLQLAEWVGLSAKTIRHRLNVLTQVFHLLDPKQPTPCDRAYVTRPKLPKRRPQGVPDDIIATTAERLAEQERRGFLRDGKTRARFLVLATCGKRPCQVMRARQLDLKWAARVWDVEPAKNSLGGPLWLNDEMLAAWQAFDRAHAWGDYDPVSFAKTLRRNGWPAGVRPYNMRHQTLQTLSQKGVDFGAVQQAAGHASPVTTRDNYVPHELETSKAASAAIEGRFPVTAFAATARYTTGLAVGGAPDYQPTTNPATQTGAGAAAPAPRGLPQAAAATTNQDYQRLLKTAGETKGIVGKISPSPKADRARPRLVKRVKTA